MVRRWRSAGSASVYLVMPAFPGWQSCSKLADNWYEDTARQATDDLAGRELLDQPRRVDDAASRHRRTLVT